MLKAEATLPVRPTVCLRLPRLNKVLGITLDAETVLSYLTRLGLFCTLNNDQILVQAPSYRFDIEIEEDLIEEVARIHGYDNIPTVPPVALLSMLPQGEAQRTRLAVRQAIVGLSYQEVINFAFVDSAWERDFTGNIAAIRLANPIASQLNVMRSTLIGGLVANLVTNQRRKQSRVQLFEMGRCFSRSTEAQPVPGFAQPWKLAMLSWGNSTPEQWGEPSRRADFFDMKGDIELLFRSFDLEFKPSQHPALHPGRSAWIFLNGQCCGVLGELHPRWVQAYDLTSPPVLAELDLDCLLPQSVPTFVELSKQPAVIRDLALLIDHSVSSGQLLEAMKNSQPCLVKDIQLFDLYTGKGIDEGKKSLAFRIVMQDTEKTLQDAEVESVLQEWIKVLEEKVAAKLRA